MFNKCKLKNFYKTVDLSEPLTIYVSPRDDLLIRINDTKITATLLPLIFVYTKDPQIISYMPNYDDNGDRDCYSTFISNFVNSDDFFELKSLVDLVIKQKEITDFFNELLKCDKQDLLCFDFMCYKNWRHNYE